MTNMWGGIMISERDLVTFLDSRYPVICFSFSSHKLTVSYQGGQYHTLSAHSLSQLPGLLKLRSVRCQFYFPNKEISQKGSFEIIEICTTRYFQCQSFSGTDINRCHRILQRFRGKSEFVFYFPKVVKTFFHKHELNNIRRVNMKQTSK